MIAVDIGNTLINLAWFKQNKLLKEAKVPTAFISKKTLLKILKEFPNEPLLICSVVPIVTKMFASLGNKVIIAGKDIDIPIKSHYAKNQAGTDRIIASYSAKVFFPGTRIIIDFGTAITVDFLSPGGDYLGGIILPGIGST
ncbi:MAG: type III pantothenate kinase, partial [Candidatus Omnitrophica bacterium]|nr:type III pantothenate kinase [Candidatus Omnitrophota bacterium]